MIDKDLALELKNAGLTWKPQDGDAYILFCTNGDEVLRIDGIGDTWETSKDVDLTRALNNIDPQSLLWLPNLDQLLSEIEHRGYKPELAWDFERRCHYLQLRDLSGWRCWRENGASRISAAGKALLWILRTPAINIAIRNMSIITDWGEHNRRFHVEREGFELKDRKL